MRDALKLTAYFSERVRVGDAFLADALFDLYERAGVRTSVLVRGVEGFGLEHHLRTDRLLTLSEDLPLASVAIDRPERIQAVAEGARELGARGLVTVERARAHVAGPEEATVPPDLAGGATKLTLYLGRGLRVGGRAAYAAAVQVLRECGVEGASVLLGVDGTMSGRRERARFLSGNSDVPLMVISVGSSARIGVALPRLARVVPGAPLTLERVRICRRDGRNLGEQEEIPDVDKAGLGMWQKLMLYTGEQAHANGLPVHVAAVRRLREEGASGATALRGIWGYHGDHAPHGDAFWALRRRVPVVTVVVDAPSRIRRWLGILEELTPERGLITSEIVPAAWATGRGSARGGLRLATPRR